MSTQGAVSNGARFHLPSSQWVSAAAAENPRSQSSEFDADPCNVTVPLGNMVFKLVIRRRNSRRLMERPVHAGEEGRRFPNPALAEKVAVPCEFMSLMSA